MPQSATVKALSWNHGKAFRALLAYGNYAYLDAHYDSFPNANNFPAVGRQLSLDGSE